MNKSQTLKILEARAFKVRIGIVELCDLAKLDRSAFSRWRNKPESMTAKSVAKLEAVLDDLENQRKANRHEFSGKDRASAPEG